GTARGPAGPRAAQARSPSAPRPARARARLRGTRHPCRRGPRSIRSDSRRPQPRVSGNPGPSVLVYPNRTRGANGWIIAPLGLSSDVIVGRTAELEALDRWLDEALEGRTRLVLIGGEAGVGKTRLTLAAEAAARERGVVVLHGECVEFGGEEF